MVITVSGDVRMERLVRLCEKHFGEFGNQSIQNSQNIQNTREVKPEFRLFDRHINRHTHQAHLLIGCEAPDIYHADKTAFTLLNNILGGPAMNSRLNVAIRERYGFCYNIESQYVPFSDTGLFYIYAGVDLDAEEKARRLIADELMRMAETSLTERQLRSAQRQMMGQMAINDDFGMNEMQSIGKAYLSYDHVNTLEEMNADLLAVTPSELMRVAQERFHPEKFSTLVYGN
jgi:predicted Zn-dependent peptidase